MFLPVLILSSFEYEKRILASVRFTTRFTGEKQELGELISIVDTARWAPSIGNVQPWEIILVHDPIELKKLSSLHPRGRVFEKASGVYIVVTDPEASPNHVIDGGSLMSYLALSASIRGYAVHIMALNDDPVIKSELSIPPKKHLLGLIAVGKPAEGQITIPYRKAVRDILHLNKYGVRMVQHG